MKPTDFCHSQQPLTAHGIIRDLIRMGVDRGSLVRPAQGGQPAAVVVFLLSPAAIREVGPWLRDFLATLPKPAQQHIIDADADSNLRLVLETMTQSQTPWLYTPLEFEPPPGAPARPAGLMCALAGPHVNAAFAAALTQRGVITNLK